MLGSLDDDTRNPETGFPSSSSVIHAPLMMNYEPPPQQYSVYTVQEKNKVNLNKLEDLSTAASVTPLSSNGSNIEKSIDVDGNKASDSLNSSQHPGYIQNALTDLKVLQKQFGFGPLLRLPKNVENKENTSDSRQEENFSRLMGALKGMNDGMTHNNFPRLLHLPAATHDEFKFPILIPKAYSSQGAEPHLTTHAATSQQMPLLHHDRKPPSFFIHEPPERDNAKLPTPFGINPFVQSISNPNGAMPFPLLSIPGRSELNRQPILVPPKAVLEFENNQTSKHLLLNAPLQPFMPTDNKLGKKK